MSTKISGSKYAAMYGPTTGDKVRLADTSLVIEVEKDYTTYGDEVKFGGGKTIRDGMGQSVKTCSKDGDLDLVITNALIVDSTGIVKADIGIKDGKIAGIGKAGNPDIMDGVTPGMTVGASTEALAGEGASIIFGAMYDDAKSDECTITVIATGLHNVGGSASKLKARLEGQQKVGSILPSGESTVRSRLDNDGSRVSAARPQTSARPQGGTMPTLQPRTPSSTVKEQSIKIPDFFKK